MHFHHEVTKLQGQCLHIFPSLHARSPGVAHAGPEVDHHVFHEVHCRCARNGCLRTTRARRVRPWRGASAAIAASTPGACRPATCRRAGSWAIWCRPWTGKNDGMVFPVWCTEWVNGWQAGGGWRGPARPHPGTRCAALQAPPRASGSSVRAPARRRRRPPASKTPAGSRWGR